MRNELDENCRYRCPVPLQQSPDFSDLTLYRAMRLEHPQNQATHGGPPLVRVRRSRPFAQAVQCPCLIEETRFVERFGNIDLCRGLRILCGSAQDIFYVAEQPSACCLLQGNGNVETNTAPSVQR